MNRANNIVTDIVLAIDAHGGDHGPGMVTAAAALALERDPRLQLALVGLPEMLEPLVRAVDAHLRSRLKIVAASRYLDSDARTVAALRRGRDSSLWNALEMVAEGSAAGCVSAGSTAAMMTLGVKLIGLIDGIQRPALMAHVPSASGHTSLLDLGANLNVSADQLVQFALMGSVVRQVSGQPPPSVGLLNVGHEDTKGHATVQAAHDRLKKSSIDYVGFVEGHDIFAGSVDVAVCDGFAGNLILKSGEGLAGMFVGSLREAFDSSARSRLGGWLSAPALRSVLERFDPSKHNGAPLLGLRRVVLKSHGRAGKLATVEAILEADKECRREVPAKIADIIKNNNEEVLE